MRSLNIFNRIFHENTFALNYLIENNIVPSLVPCSCTGNKNLILITRSNKTKPYFLCNRSSCRNKTSLLSGTIFCGTKLSLHKIFTIISFFINNISNLSVLNLTDISESTYIRFKKRIINLIKINYNTEKIGGGGRRVQIDETIIVRGRFIRNPTSSFDEIRNAIWLVGGVEEDEPDRMFLEIVPNRRAETMQELIRRKVHPDSVIITDGYPSYVPALRTLNIEHHVVNHSMGFVNEDGYHTNTIENLWGHLKIEMRARYGVLRCNWEEFIVEFAFRKRYLMNRERESYQRVFDQLLIKIFNF